MLNTYTLMFVVDILQMRYQTLHPWLTLSYSGKFPFDTVNLYLKTSAVFIKTLMFILNILSRDTICLLISNYTLYNDSWLYYPALDVLCLMVSSWCLSFSSAQPPQARSLQTWDLDFLKLLNCLWEFDGGKILDENNHVIKYKTDWM